MLEETLSPHRESTVSSFSGATVFLLSSPEEKTRLSTLKGVQSKDSSQPHKRRNSSSRSILRRKREKISSPPRVGRPASHISGGFEGHVFTFSQFLRRRISDTFEGRRKPRNLERQEKKTAGFIAERRGGSDAGWGGLWGPGSGPEGRGEKDDHWLGETVGKTWHDPIEGGVTATFAGEKIWDKGKDVLPLCKGSEECLPQKQGEVYSRRIASTI